VRAVVIGSGPNGLCGAIALAQAGLDVEVHEEQATIGGGARSLELTLPGFVHDVCSAIHPLGRDSPFLRSLELELEWVEPPAQVAHPFDDGTAVTVERDVDATADQLGGDARAYRELVGPLVEHWEAVEPVLLGPLPAPPRAAARLARALGARAALRLVRAALADARGLAEQTFAGERARALLAGNASHSLLPLERRPTGGFALALLALGHVAGWGFPRGGAQRISDALAAKARELGVEVVVESRVDRLPDSDVVLADVSPRELLRLARGRFPARYERALERYRYGVGAFKVDWALDGPVPWRAEAAARTATLHLGGTLAELSASEWSPWAGRAAERPFVLFAQHTLFDPTRAPEGKHTAWGYCHVPHASSESMTERIEAQVERFAPGFRELVHARSELGPLELEARNRNLVGGDINVGAMDLGQLLTRPTRRRVPYRTPLAGVYLCSAATPPGAGVHGLCGWSAARVALADLAERA
jgi:phytoene dehydrogenase-like protein